MKKRIDKVGEISWIIGNILCATGNCLVAKGGFGVASVVAPAFIANAKFEELGLGKVFTVGICEYIIQGILLLLCCLIIGKFKPKFFATICNIIFYGACFDIMNALLSFIQPTELVGRTAVTVIGFVIVGFAVALMLRTYIPPSAYEIFVREIAEEKKRDVSKLKLVFDTSMLLFSILVMFVLLGRFEFSIIGPMTVIAAVMTSVLIGFFGKWLDKHFSFTPAIPKLYNLLNPNSKI